MTTKKTPEIVEADQRLRDAIEHCLRVYNPQVQGPMLILDTSVVVVSQIFDKDTGEIGPSKSDIFFAGDSPPRYRAYGVLNEHQEALDGFWTTDDDEG